MERISLIINHLPGWGISSTTDNIIFNNVKGENREIKTK